MNVSLEPLQTTLLKALTNLESPKQSLGVPIDSEKYQVLGSIPVAAQHLHNICCELKVKICELDSRVCQAADRGDHDKGMSLFVELKSLQERYELISSLRSGFIQEAISFDTSKYTCLVIMEGWLAAGLKLTKQESQESQELSKVFMEIFGQDINQTSEFLFDPPNDN